MHRRVFLGLLGALGGWGASAWAQLGVPRAPGVAPRAFAPITILNMATRNAGTYPFSPQAVQAGIIGALLTLDVSQATDPLPALSGVLEGSLDGGATWLQAGGFGPRAAGPKGLNRVGQALTELTPLFGGGTFWSASANPNRQLRGSATLGGTMRFSMTVTPL